MEGILDILNHERDLDMANEGLGQALKDTGSKISGAFVTAGKAIGNFLRGIASRIATAFRGVTGAIAARDANIKPIIQEVNKSMSAYSKAISHVARGENYTKIEEAINEMKAASDRVDTMVEELRTSGVKLSPMSAKAAVSSINSWATVIERLTDASAKALEKSKDRDIQYMWKNLGTGNKNEEKAQQRGDNLRAKTEAVTAMRKALSYAKSTLEVASKSIFSLLPTKEEKQEKKDMHKNMVQITKQMNKDIKANAKAQKLAAKAAAKEAKKAAKAGDTEGAAEALIDMINFMTGEADPAIEGVKYMDEYELESLALESEMGSMLSTLGLA